MFSQSVQRVAGFEGCVQSAISLEGRLLVRLTAFGPPGSSELVALRKIPDESHCRCELV